MSKALEDIATERQRQIKTKGWTPEHDDKHTDGAIARAAADFAETGQRPPSWSWAYNSKIVDKDPRRTQLVKAGALIVAEIERLDRAAANSAAVEERCRRVARTS